MFGSSIFIISEAGNAAGPTISLINVVAVDITTELHLTDIYFSNNIG